MADQFGVVPEALTGHASNLQSVADALQQAVDAPAGPHDPASTFAA